MNKNGDEGNKETVEVWVYPNMELRDEKGKGHGKLAAEISSWKELDDLEYTPGYFKYFHPKTGDDLSWYQMSEILGERQF